MTKKLRLLDERLLFKHIYMFEVSDLLTNL